MSSLPLNVFERIFGSEGSKSTSQWGGGGGDFDRMRVARNAGRKEIKAAL
jgi:hypothetical protein